METDMIADVNEEELWDLSDKFDTETIKEDKTKCINCKSGNLNSNNNTGFIECIDCGTCQGRVMDNKPEWSVYEDGKNEGIARCGHATSYYYPKSSLCSEPVKSNDYMIDVLQTWIRMKYDEYSLSVNLAYIAHICSKNYLPPAVIENAKLIYKLVHDTRIIIRGVKERNGIFSACVQIGAQLQKYYRSPEEIGVMFDGNAKLVTNGRNRLTKILYDNPLINSIPPVVPTDFIRRFCYKLNFTEKQIDEIYDLADNVRKLYIASNHQPMSIAAGCVLIYVHIKKLNIPEESVLIVFNITSATTTKIFNKILPYCKIIIDNEKQIW
jgi:transcription initiation factor TFIIIB Brf1 subunit/transcription initiation factor TFIIB